MIIGIPKSLLYYQYGVMWTTFLEELGCEVLLSCDTNGALFEEGVRKSVSECCLPAKAYLGHVHSLINRCDYILVPYATRKTGGDEICLRFWGLGDVIRHTYPEARLLEYDLCKDGFRHFKTVGKILGRNPRNIRSAYKTALAAQTLFDEKLQNAQTSLLTDSRLKILVAGRPYVIHDPYIGGSVIKILSDLNSVPLFSDRFAKKDSMEQSAKISPRLYWTANREITGAVAANQHMLDGVLILTAFPCAPDALSGEMIQRVVKDIPVGLISLDGLQSEAGLQTRIESFVDIMREC